MRTMRNLVVLGLAALFVAAGAAGAAAQSERGPVVLTPSGELEGAWADAEAGVSVFRGVPFAQPPVGDLRWRPPVAVESWDGTRAATEFGPACWQARNADNSALCAGRAAA